MDQLNLFSPQQPSHSPKPASHPVKKKEQHAAKPKQKRGRKSLKTMQAEPEIVRNVEAVPLDKQYYSISEVAEMFHVNASLIRFWENEFDILKPKKNRKGDRLFRQEDIHHLRLIYHLVRERKYTLEGAKQKLKEDKKKVQQNFELVQSLLKIRHFLLQLKENM
jgi:DNA-binding transcriptional MerR regulator